MSKDLGTNTESCPAANNTRRHLEKEQEILSEKVKPDMRIQNFD